MFKQIALVLVLPPVSLVFLIMAGLLLASRQPATGRRLAWAGTLALLLLALPAAGDSLIASLEGGATLQASPIRPAAIVILGGDEEEQAGAPSSVIGALTLQRLRAGAALARRTGLPVLVSGGSFHPDTVSLAALMQRSLADDFAVPTRWLEDRSATTWDNAERSAAMLRASGIGSVYVVTQAWHMRRALIAFRHFGLAVTPAPTLVDRPASLAASDFVPRVSAWQHSYFALHEWVGCADYALRDALPSFGDSR